MITARKSAWFSRLFALYNRNLLARRFDSLRARGLEHLRRDAVGPLLLYCNHSSWWDGLVAFHLSQECRLDSYAMMEEKQLREYPFHRKIGAFSVVRDDARRAMESIEYAARLLREGGDRVLWIFPQGATEPNDVRPLKLYTGAARIAEKADALDAAPVALRYEFLNEYRPEIFVRIGRPEGVPRGAARLRPRQLTAFFAEKLTGELDALRADITLRATNGYEEIIRARKRVQGNG